MMGIPADVLIGRAEASEGVLEAPEIDYTRFPLKEMFDRGCFGNFTGNATISGRTSACPAGSSSTP